MNTEGAYSHLRWFDLSPFLCEERVFEPSDFKGNTFQSSGCNISNDRCDKTPSCAHHKINIHLLVPPYELVHPCCIDIWNLTDRVQTHVRGRDDIVSISITDSTRLNQEGGTLGWVRIHFLQLSEKVSQDREPTVVQEIHTDRFLSFLFLSFPFPFPFLSFP